jgi:hypothetical protein
MRAAARQLNSLADNVERGDARRDDFGLVIADILGAQRERFGPRPRAKRGAGAKATLLRYLQHHVGQVVYGEELAAASGIQEWARRLRELRVEDGYDICELGNSSYKLTKVEPDTEQADSWRELNEIRGRKGSGRSRVEALFEARVGEVVTRGQVDYVSNIKEGSRRIRELRDEGGWPIDSYIDDPSLKPGEYRLLSADPSERRDASQRLYPDDLRRRVFERDAYTCQICKRNREMALREGDTRFYLEVHHKVAIADEVAGLPVDERNNIDNLVTLCHRDHSNETARLHDEKRRRRMH